ncbi:MAG: sigma-70 family RNA polymerase sigma factor [Acidobacteriaceae bacterium]
MATATIPALFGRPAKLPVPVSNLPRRVAPLTRDKTPRPTQPLAKPQVKENRLVEAHMSPEEPKSQPQIQGDRMAVLAEQKALADLAARCLAGDGQAWEQLARSQHRRIYGICYRFTGSQSDAEDLAQEAFLKMYRNLGSFDPEKGGFTTWLTTLTRNLLVDNYRRSRLERSSDSLDDSFDGEDDGPTKAERLADTGKSQEQHVAGLELRAQIQEALKQVSPDLREAVILRDLEDMDYKEIAEILGVPQGTVKSRISRGRSELARLLKRIEGQVM